MSRLKDLCSDLRCRLNHSACKSPHPPDASRNSLFPLSPPSLSANFSGPSLNVSRPHRGVFPDPVAFHRVLFLRRLPPPHPLPDHRRSYLLHYYHCRCANLFISPSAVDVLPSSFVAARPQCRLIVSRDISVWSARPSSKKHKRIHVRDGFTSAAFIIICILCASRTCPANRNPSAVVRMTLTSGARV